MSKRRKVTQTESDKNIEQLYREINEGIFEPGTVGFEDENSQNDDAADISSDEEDVVEEQDDTRDHDVAPDPIVTDELPTKQKFKSA